jgi:membrane-bound serine protease (ClpP class)
MSSTPRSRTLLLAAAAAAIATALASLLGLAGPAPAGAQATTTPAPTTTAAGGAAPPAGSVEVVEVAGLLDDVLVSFVEDRIDAVQRGDYVSVVLQLNSPGATVSDERITSLARRMRDSAVPVAVWVGPSGAQARGAAAQLVAVAQPGGLAQGAQLGKSGPQVLPRDEFGDLWGEQATRLESAFVRGNEDNLAAIEQLGLVLAPTLGDFVVDLETVPSQQVTEGDQVRRQPLVDVRFTQLPLTAQLMHTVASPSVAYLLLAIGLGLLVFELYTAGIGIAGVVGAGCLALGCYGIVALPTRPWALVALVVSFVAFAVDVQTGVPRLWTGVGFALFLVGTLFLFDGVSLSWITMLVGLVGIALAFLSGMPAMVRSRFSTPTIGREWMIGEMGLALTAVSPDGTVSVRSARWPARTNRATPIAVGDRVRVVGIEGVVLEVEPEEGGAVDYRERRRAASPGTSPAPDRDR